MSQLLFVWLGSKRAKKRRVGAPGVLLAGAARAGLPVPAGAILLDDVYRLALDEGVAVVGDGRVIVPDPALLHDLLYEGVRFPIIDAPVAVRPVLPAEEEASEKQGEPASLQLFVDFASPGQVAISLGEAWSAALQRPGEGRFDVLVTRMVTAEVAGVAISRQAAEEDEIYYSQKASYPTARGVTEALSLSRPRWWWQSSEGIPPFAQRLQRLLRGVRRTFGNGDWRVEWIDDGEVCWLWGVRAFLDGR